MKIETLKQAGELFVSIESVQEAKDALDRTTEVDLRILNRGSIGKIRLTSDCRHSYFDGMKAPDELMAQIKEEFVRAVQRAKRHCEEWEFKLKQQLEDL